MMQDVILSQVPGEQIASSYQWINIEHDDQRVGKLRGQPKGSSFVINSIQIFPEFERKGFARQTVEAIKQEYNPVIADRVRYTAKGFWKKLGFEPCSDGNYIYDREA